VPTRRSTDDLILPFLVVLELGNLRGCIVEIEHIQLTLPEHQCLGLWLWHDLHDQLVERSLAAEIVFEGRKLKLAVVLPVVELEWPGADRLEAKVGAFLLCVGFGKIEPAGVARFARNGAKGAARVISTVWSSIFLSPLVVSAAPFKRSSAPAIMSESRCSTPALLG
jgi:hypothetical protein